MTKKRTAIRSPAASPAKPPPLSSLKPPPSTRSAKKNKDSSSIASKSRYPIFSKNNGQTVAIATADVKNAVRNGKNNVSRALYAKKSANLDTIDATAQANAKEKQLNIKDREEFPELNSDDDSSTSQSTKQNNSTKSVANTPENYYDALNEYNGDEDVSSKDTLMTEKDTTGDKMENKLSNITTMTEDTLDDTDYKQATTDSDTTTITTASPPAEKPTPTKPATNPYKKHSKSTSKKSSKHTTQDNDEMLDDDTENGDKKPAAKPSQAQTKAGVTFAKATKAGTPIKKKLPKKKEEFIYDVELSFQADFPKKERELRERELRDNMDLMIQLVNSKSVEMTLGPLKQNIKTANLRFIASLTQPILTGSRNAACLPQLSQYSNLNSIGSDFRSYYPFKAKFDHKWSNFSTNIHVEASEIGLKLDLARGDLNNEINLGILMPSLNSIDTAILKCDILEEFGIKISVRPQQYIAPASNKSKGSFVALTSIRDQKASGFGMYIDPSDPNLVESIRQIKELYPMKKKPHLSEYPQGISLGLFPVDDQQQLLDKVIQKWGTEHGEARFVQARADDWQHSLTSVSMGGGKLNAKTLFRQKDSLYRQLHLLSNGRETSVVSNPRIVILTMLNPRTQRPFFVSVDPAQARQPIESMTPTVIVLYRGRNPPSPEDIEDAMNAIRRIPALLVEKFGLSQLQKTLSPHVLVQLSTGATAYQDGDIPDIGSTFINFGLDENDDNEADVDEAQDDDASLGLASAYGIPSDVSPAIPQDDASIVSAMSGNSATVRSSGTAGTGRTTASTKHRLVEEQFRNEALTAENEEMAHKMELLQAQMASILQKLPASPATGTASPPPVPSPASAVLSQTVPVKPGTKSKPFTVQDTSDDSFSSSSSDSSSSDSSDIEIIGTTKSSKVTATLPTAGTDSDSSNSDIPDTPMHQSDHEEMSVSSDPDRPDSASPLPSASADGEGLGH